jgi:hypothetical protein
VKDVVSAFSTRHSAALATVCHLLSGTSKQDQNRASLRLVNHYINWRGKPLLSYRTIVRLTAANTTNAGLKVRAMLERN